METDNRDRIGREEFVRIVEPRDGPGPVRRFVILLLTCAALGVGVARGNSRMAGSTEQIA